MMCYPNPNPQGIYEVAEVLYSGETTLISREPKSFELPMQLRSGQSLSVNGIRGYEDERLRALYRQKSVSELYQAFHRARPYGTTKVKEVLVFTDVPIDGVPVDSFLSKGRHDRVFDTLSGLLEQCGGVVTVPKHVDNVMDNYSQSESNRKAVDTWVRREENVAWLT